MQTIPVGSTVWARPRALWVAARARPQGPQLACRPTHLAPLGWLALHALALWPHGVWVLRRWHDGSDDPLGIAALALLAVALARLAPRLAVAPRAGWVGASALLTIAANGLLVALPPLPAALVAAAAFGAALAAWLPRGVARGPLAALLLLALPVVASLQYYAGYPLRAITAQASAALLSLAGVAAEASGAALSVDGRLVIVDAPCSGVQLAWLGYFAASAAAALRGLGDRAFVRRLPLVGVLALAANVLRNTGLVALEARPAGLDPHWHEAIGLGAVALAALAAALWMGRGERHGDR